jgi:hypothetical protein
MAVCQGYLALYRTIVDRIGVKDLESLWYQAQAKGMGWNAMDPPATPTANQLSILVKIDGNKYLSDPSWGTGHIDSSKRFVPAYNEGRFLQALICTLNDRFPLNGSEKHLDAPFPYERFLRCPRYQPSRHEFLHESHPFARFECKRGFLKVQFSVNLSAEQVWGRAYLVQQNKLREADHMLQTSELVLKKCEAVRDFFNPVLRKVATYQVILFLNEWAQAESYVDNLEICNEVPFLRYAAGNFGFMPIAPTVARTKVTAVSH